MSRYEARSATLKCTIAYGWDRPLAEYFLDVNGQHLCGPLSNTYGDSATMLRLIRQKNLAPIIPQAHLDAIIASEPF